MANNKYNIGPKWTIVGTFSEYAQFVGTVRPTTGGMLKTGDRMPFIMGTEEDEYLKYIGYGPLNAKTKGKKGKAGSEDVPKSKNSPSGIALKYEAMKPKQRVKMENMKGLTLAAEGAWIGRAAKLHSPYTLAVWDEVWQICVIINFASNGSKYAEKLAKEYVGTGSDEAAQIAKLFEDIRKIPFDTDEYKKGDKKFNYITKDHDAYLEMEALASKAYKIVVDHFVKKYNLKGKKIPLLKTAGYDTGKLPVDISPEELVTNQLCDSDSNCTETADDDTSTETITDYDATREEETTTGGKTRFKWTPIFVTASRGTDRVYPLHFQHQTALNIEPTLDSTLAADAAKEAGHDPPSWLGSDGPPWISIITDKDDRPSDPEADIISQDNISNPAPKAYIPPYVDPYENIQAPAPPPGYPEQESSQTEDSTYSDAAPGTTSLVSNTGSNASLGLSGPSGPGGTSGTVGGISVEFDIAEDKELQYHSRAHKTYQDWRYIDTLDTPGNLYTASRILTDEDVTITPLASGREIDCTDNWIYLDYPDRSMLYAPSAIDADGEFFNSGPLEVGRTDDDITRLNSNFYGFFRKTTLGDSQLSLPDTVREQYKEKESEYKIAVDIYIADDPRSNTNNDKVFKQQPIFFIKKTYTDESILSGESDLEHAFNIPDLEPGSDTDAGPDNPNQTEAQKEGLVDSHGSFVGDRWYLYSKTNLFASPSAYLDNTDVLTDWESSHILVASIRHPVPSVSADDVKGNIDELAGDVLFRVNPGLFALKKVQPEDQESGRWLDADYAYVRKFADFTESREETGGDVDPLRQDMEDHVQSQVVNIIKVDYHDVNNPDPVSGAPNSSVPYSSGTGNIIQKVEDPDDKTQAYYVVLTVRHILMDSSGWLSGVKSHMDDIMIEPGWKYTSNNDQKWNESPYRYGLHHRRPAIGVYQDAGELEYTMPLGGRRMLDAGFVIFKGDRDEYAKNLPIDTEFSYDSCVNIDLDVRDKFFAYNQGTSGISTDPNNLNKAWPFTSMNAYMAGYPVTDGTGGKHTDKRLQYSTIHQYSSGGVFFPELGNLETGQVDIHPSHQTTWHSVTPTGRSKPGNSGSGVWIYDADKVTVTQNCVVRSTDSNIYLASLHGCFSRPAQESVQTYKYDESVEKSVSFGGGGAVYSKDVTPKSSKFDFYPYNIIVQSREEQPTCDHSLHKIVELLKYPTLDDAKVVDGIKVPDSYDFCEWNEYTRLAHESDSRFTRRLDIDSVYVPGTSANDETLQTYAGGARWYINKTTTTPPAGSTTPGATTTTKQPCNGDTLCDVEEWDPQMAGMSISEGECFNANGSIWQARVDDPSTSPSEATSMSGPSGSPISRDYGLFYIPASAWLDPEVQHVDNILFDHAIKKELTSSTSVRSWSLYSNKVSDYLPSDDDNYSNVNHWVIAERSTDSTDTSDYLFFMQKLILRNS